VDLREAIRNVSAMGVEWREENGWVAAEQLRFAPPLGHLYAYMLASNFIVPIHVPTGLTAAA